MSLYDDIDTSHPIFICCFNQLHYQRETGTRHYDQSISNDFGTVVRWAKDKVASWGDHASCLSINVLHLTQPMTTSELHERLAGPLNKLPQSRQLWLVHPDEYQSVAEIVAYARAVFPQYFISSTPTEEPMPQTKTEPTPVTPAPSRQLVKVDIKRENGVLFLSIDARPLHDFLDAVGVPKANGKYTEQPRVGYEVVDVRASKLAPGLFLETTYPKKIKLSSVLSESGTPVTFDRLKRIADSSYDVVKDILTHYQPIDISVTVQKREG